MTIRSDEELAQSVEQLLRMHRALNAIRQDVLPISPRRFALMAEGPRDEISQLRQQIDKYTGADAAQEHDTDVWLRIEGPGLAWPDAPTSVLTAFLEALRKGVQTVAEVIATGQLTTRPTKKLKRSCDLRVMAMLPGSLRVGLRVPTEGDAQLELVPPEAPPLAEQALRQYLEVAAWVGSDEAPELLEEQLDDTQRRRMLLTAVKRLVPRPRGDVSLVELSGRAVPTRIQLTRQARERIDQAIDRAVAERTETHAGDLREIDLDKCSFILRSAELVTEIPCTFDESLIETAKEALDRRVEVTGSRLVETGRRAHKPLRVTRLEILDDEDADIATLVEE